MMKSVNPLTDTAYEILVADLESYGNQLNQNHRDALYALVRTMTDMSQGGIQGRYAFSLPCGLGKTQGIIAWITALNKLELDSISVSVSASKVEALCSLKRDLIAHGVPESKIGLLHSYQHDSKSGVLKSGYASLPSTGSNDRQIMLVTHNRLRNGKPDKRYHSHKGKPRSLMLYDESLIVSDSRGIDFIKLKGDIAKVSAMHEGEESYHDLIQYIEKTRDTIQATLQRLKDNPDSDNACVVHLDVINADDMKSFQNKVANTEHVYTLTDFLEVCQLPLRIINTGVISYQLAVSPEIKNILILDASYPIRELIKLDESIKDAQEALPYLKSLNVNLSQLKRFDNVKVKQMYASGSRNAMTKQFSQYPNDQLVVKDAVKVIKGIPGDESVLIFTYKDKQGGVKFTHKLIKALQKSGIDCDETVTYQNHQRKRINIVTWGNETSLNDFNHCKHVMLLGVMYRSSMDLSSCLVGQSNDLKAPIDNTEVFKIQKSELTHLIYQAASRGSCRTINNGYAEPMNLYLIDKHKDIKSSLAAVMPNLNWGEWNGEYSEVNEGLIIKTAKTIYEYLNNTELTSISIRKLKTILQLNDMHKNTFKESWKYCLNKKTTDWKLQGRSLVSVYQGFSVEPT